MPRFTWINVMSATAMFVSFFGYVGTGNDFSMFICIVNAGNLVFQRSPEVM